MAKLSYTNPSYVTPDEFSGLISIEVDDLEVVKKLKLDTSSVADITAVGGITVTNPSMRVQGSGGPVIITANPQISAGVSGQILFVRGSCNANTITFHDEDGLHLHSGSEVILGCDDYIMFQYSAGHSAWDELASNFNVTERSWAFSSPAGDFGTYYVGGSYLFGSTSFTPAGGTTLGSALSAYGAHAFIVLGATSTDMVVRISGTSFTGGVRIASDFEDIDTSGGVLNDYFETTKRWIGQVTYSLQSGTGVEINNGLCKCWDNRNSDFRITAVEITGLAGANDTNPDFSIIHHKHTGWTFNSGSSPTPPTALASMESDHGNESRFINGESFVWKRQNMNFNILGSSGEGFIGQIVTTANKSIQSLNWLLSTRPY